MRIVLDALDQCMCITANKVNRLFVIWVVLVSGLLFFVALYTTY